MSFPLTARLCLLAAILTSAAIVGASEKPKHLIMAQQLVINLQGASENVYGGGARSISWDPTTPHARSVCSSFTTLLLSWSYNLEAADIKKMGFGSNPMASDYFDAATAGHGFDRLSKAADIMPGDFLFVKYNDGHTTKEGVEDTGHVMLVVNAPVALDKKDEAMPDGTVYGIDVIDSSASGHGIHDTRHTGKNQFSGGVGQGTIRIVADANSGKIVAYSWSDTKKSEYFSAPGREMIAARLNLDFFKESK